MYYPVQASPIICYVYVNKHTHALQFSLDQLSLYQHNTSGVH